MPRAGLHQRKKLLMLRRRAHLRKMPLLKNNSLKQKMLALNNLLLKVTKRKVVNPRREAMPRKEVMPRKEATARREANEELTTNYNNKMLDISIGKFKDMLKSKLTHNHFLFKLFLCSAFFNYSQIFINIIQSTLNLLYLIN